MKKNRDKDMPGEIKEKPKRRREGTGYNPKAIPQSREIGKFFKTLI